MAGDVVEYVNTDPRRYLSELGEKESFDVIAVNQPDPSNGLLNRFYTYEFYSLVAKRLSEKGIFVITATGTPNYEFGDISVYCGTLYQTLQNVFPTVIAVPGTQWWFYASTARDLQINPEELARQFRANEISCPMFSPEFYSLYFDVQRIEQLQSILNEKTNLPVNSDERPLCYLYDLLLWSKQYGYFKWLPVESLARSPLVLFGFVGGFAFLFYAFLAGTVRFLLPYSLKPAFAPLMILMMTGLASIGTEIAVLFFFQSRVGYLYQHVGLFLGFFMFGLALGSSLGTRLIHYPGRKVGEWIKKIEILLLIGLLCTPAVFQWIDFWNPTVVWTELILLIWIVILSFCMGCLFPLVSRATELCGRELTMISGWVDMTDCLGGALGALLFGSLLLPLIGLTNVCMILLGIKCLNFIVAYIKIK